MPVSYGSSMRAIVPLSTAQIGKVEVKSAPKSSMTSFLRILVAILEVGLMVGAAAAAPFTGGASLAIDVGIGLAGAGANLGISAAEGEIPALSTAFDFASAFIPGAMGLASAGRIARAGTKIDKAALDAKLADKATKAANEAVEKNSNRLLKRIGRTEERRQSTLTKMSAAKQRQTDRVAGRYNQIKANNARHMQKAADFRVRFATGKLTNREKAILEMYGGTDSPFLAQHWAFKNAAKGRRDNAIDHLFGKLTPVRGMESRAMLNQTRSIGQKNISALSAKVTRQNREIVGLGHELANVAAKYHTTMEDIMKSLQEMHDIFDRVKDYSVVKKLSTSSFMAQLEKETDNKFVLEVLQEAYGDAIRGQTWMGGLALAQTASRAASNRAVRQIGKRLAASNPQDAMIWQSLRNRLTQMGKIKSNVGRLNSNIAYRDNIALVQGALSSLSLEGQRIVSELGQLDPKAIVEMFMSFQKHSDPSKLVRLIKKAGSRDFNDKWVQTAQLIDANDFGRYGPERAYQFLKDKIEGILEKSAFKKAWVASKKVIKESQNLQNAFERSGGLMIPGTNGQIPGNYLFGYKIVDRNPVNGWHTVFLKFVKETTNGKADVLIRATEHDLKMLREEGVQYYWRVGKRKGWWISKGGRKVSTSLSTVSSSLSLFLSFVPIPALRNVMSIVSNWVENASSMAKGEYFKDWFGKFERAFVRTSINRAVRLATRVALGGLYKQAYMAKVTPKLAEQASKMATKQAAGKFAGEAVAKAKIDAYIATTTAKEFGRLESKALGRSNWLGRELQRVTSVALGTVESYDKSSGLFEFRTDKYGERFVKKFVQGTVPTAVKGSLIRSSTRKFNSLGRVNSAKALIGARRNLGQVTRIYGSATPNGVVKPLRSLTTFKI